MCTRWLKTTVLAAVGGAMWIQMPSVTLRLKNRRPLSLKCWFLGHEDLIRRAPDRLYLECFECGRETHGWTTNTNHPTDRAGGGAVQAAPMSKRSDHLAPASVRSSTRQSLNSECSIAHDGDITMAA